MHGRLKIRTTEEQKLIKDKEQKKKLEAYRNGMQLILSTRYEIPYNVQSFGVCAQLLMVNPDIYTLWNYRKEVVLKVIENAKVEGEHFDEKLNKFLKDELKLTEQCLLANPKSYGSWHHRYWIMEQHTSPDWDKEFELCTNYLTKDDRNFHCWDYRRLILKKIGINHSLELAFSTDRLNMNFSNYSSWHYRSTLLLNHLNQSALDNEIQLVQSAVFTDPGDSSAWFYLKWLMSNEEVSTELRTEFLLKLEQLEDLEPNCKWIYKAKCWLQNNGTVNEKYCYEKLKELDPLRLHQYQEILDKL